jgi:hypothetical protein
MAEGLKKSGNAASLGQTCPMKVSLLSFKKTPAYYPLINAV